MTNQKHKTIRTSEGLRNTLFDTLDAFMNGEVSAIDAKTTAKLADSLLKSVTLDMENKRLVQQLTATQTDGTVANLELNVVMGSNDNE